MIDSIIVKNGLILTLAVEIIEHYPAILQYFIYLANPIGRVGERYCPKGGGYCLDDPKYGKKKTFPTSHMD